MPTIDHATALALIASALALAIAAALGAYASLIHAAVRMAL